MNAALWVAYGAAGLVIWILVHRLVVRGVENRWPKLLLLAAILVVLAGLIAVQNIAFPAF